MPKPFVPPAGSYEAIRSLVERVEGYMMLGQEEYLFNKVRSLPETATILEIGSFKGRSTVAMGLAALGSQRKLFCIDTWNGNEKDFPDRSYFETWQQNIRQAGVDSVITPLCGLSHEVLARWPQLVGDGRIDFVFIDGSHDYADVLKDLQLVWPLVNDKGWIALHDVHYTWPGPKRVWFDVAKRSLTDHEYASSLACGRKAPSAVLAQPCPDSEPTATRQLPVHFFTNVLNGMPYIRHHVTQMQQLSFDWHWHVIEGVADLKQDTAWSVANGGHIPQFAHEAGRSTDGTTQYLDELQQKFPDRITVYRKPLGTLWNGKLEMVNQPVMTITEECLLWEIDADEIWTDEQFTAGRQLFLDHPTKTAAFYWCWCFVGPRLVTSSRRCYANNPRMEWLRTWRFRPGMRWLAHEPPLLVEPRPKGKWRPVAKIDPLLHAQTEAAGLVFQHYAYATRAQVRFKQDYYGYPGAVDRWEALQAVKEFPVKLRDYFPWVKDHTQVDRAEHYVPHRLIDLPDPILSSKVPFPPDRADSNTKPLSAASLFETAVQYHRQGDLVQAGSFCRKILAEQPNHLRALDLLGCVCNQTGRSQEALDLLHRMIALEPNVPEFHNNLAATLGSMGRLEESASVLRRGLAMRPDYASFYVNLGVTLAKLGQFEESVRVCRRAMALGRSDALLHRNLAMSLEKLGRSWDAEALL